MTERHATGFDSFEQSEQAYIRQERERRDLRDLMEDKEHQYYSPGDVCGFNGCSSMACKRLGYCPYRVRACAVLEALKQPRKTYISGVRSKAGRKGKGKKRRPRLRLAV